MRRQICIATVLMVFGFIVFVTPVMAQTPYPYEQSSDSLNISMRSAPYDSLEIEYSPNSTKWWFDPGKSIPNGCRCPNPIDECRCGHLIAAPLKPGTYSGIPFFVGGKLHIYCGLEGEATCVIDEK